MLCDLNWASLFLVLKPLCITSPRHGLSRSKRPSTTYRSQLSALHWFPSTRGSAFDNACCVFLARNSKGTSVHIPNDLPFRSPA